MNPNQRYNNHPNQQYNMNPQNNNLHQQQRNVQPQHAVVPIENCVEGTRRMDEQLVSMGKSQSEYKASFGCCEKITIMITWFFSIILPFMWFFIPKTVKEYERALIFRMGKLVGKAAGPGLFVVNPFLDSFKVVDLRVRTFQLNPQAMMTKDSVTVTIDAIVFMRVQNCVRAVLEVDDYHQAFLQFAATTLRSVVGTYELEPILCERDQINETIRMIIEKETTQWGVTVPAVEIKDVKLPANMQRAMAAEAEAERERRAMVIKAMGESQAAVKLAEAADVIAASPGALQLRYLSTLVKISAEKNSTILFPLPMEVMRGVQAFTDHVKMQSEQMKAKAVHQLDEVKEDQ